MVLIRKKDGYLLPAIPEPFYVLGLKRCKCLHLSWTRASYQKHYVTRHVYDI